MGLVKRIYDSYLRTHLPKKIGVYNGVAIRRPYLFDKTDEIADSKTGIVRGVRETVTRGDTVVEIGTGGGLAAVWAARQSVDGPVYTYDGAISKIEKFKETARLNQVADIVFAEAAIIRNEDNATAQVAGGTNDGNITGTVISVADLPLADVYVLDCEGAEAELIPEISSGQVVVETHGMKGVSADEITAELTANGFIINTIYGAKSKKSPNHKVVIATHE